MQYSYNRQLQALIEEYRREFGDEMSVPEIAAWLIREGRWKPSMREAMTLLSRDLSQAMRTQYVMSPDGLRVRRKHAVKRREKLFDGTYKQLVLWRDIETAPPNFMQESFQQRRIGIVDDCWQLEKDRDCYNKYYNKAEAIEMLFDFREDLEEHRAASEDSGQADQDDTDTI